jgi:bacteriorhodopsin
MVGCGAFGSLTVGNVKWVWWFFGMCWFMHIIFALGKSWAESAKARSAEAGTVYGRAAGLTVIAWFCYPVIWVFAEGFGNFSVTFEVRSYTLLLFPMRFSATVKKSLLCNVWFFSMFVIYYMTQCCD